MKSATLRPSIPPCGPAMFSHCHIPDFGVRENEEIVIELGKTDGKGAHLGVAGLTDLFELFVFGPYVVWDTVHRVNIWFG